MSMVQGGVPGREANAEGRPIVYCLIPADLAPRLLDHLRAHFRDSPDIEVVIERRGGDRRLKADRRQGEQASPDAAERRQVRSATGRRVGERRAKITALGETPDLPRRARRHAERIRFVRRIEPSTSHAEDLDSARLVDRFQAGERDAFTELYMRYFARVYGYLRVVLNDRDEAEDATQHVFLKALESLPRYERRKQPFRAWLFVIARNYSVDLLQRSGRLDICDPAEIHRARRAGETLEGAEQEVDIPSWIADRDLVLFIERLPLPQRQVLLLRYALDLPTERIASILERSTADVRMLQSRALRYLRERLSALGREPRRERQRKMRRRSLGRSGVVRSRRFALLP